MENELFGLTVKTWLILGGAGLALLFGWLLLRMALRLAAQVFRVGCFLLVVLFLMLVGLAFAINPG